MPLFISKTNGKAMGDITFGGLSSGMDTAAIVDAIMQAERAPLRRLQKRQKINDERIDAYSDFNDKLKALQESAEKLGDQKGIQSSRVTLGSEDNISVDSSGLATNGEYTIAVKQLSQVQKNVSSGFESATAGVGAGMITFTVDGVENPFSIEINGDNNTLADVVAAVNKQSEKTGVTASIINDGSENGYRIIFSGKNAATRFDIAGTLTGGSNDAVNFGATEKTQSAQQAVAFIDGIKIVSDSNTLKNAVPGVDITLDKISRVIDQNALDSMQGYETTRLGVAPDNEAMKEKINSFVNAYNDIIKYLKKGTDDASSMNSYLRTDSTVRNIKRQMQAIVTSAFGDNSGSMVMLAQAGVETQKDGTLRVDSEKLNNAVTDNYTSFVNMFAGAGEKDGIMDKFAALMDRYTDRVDGLYNGRKKTHDSVAQNIENQITRMESRLEKRKDSLAAQFSAMEEMMALFTAQASFLSSALL